MSKISHQQILDQLETFEAFLYFHGYQPPRLLQIEDQLIFDITGTDEHEGGYNERVWDRCYHPMTIPITQEGIDNPVPILQHPLVAEHIFGVTRDWIKHFHPHSWDSVHQVLADASIPFVDPYLHQILPLLPEQAQHLMVRIGIRAWQEDMDRKLVNDQFEPQTGFGFWLPELGVTHKTVEILAANGVSFLVLDQAQVHAEEYAPIYQIETATHPVYVFAYNGKEFAQKMAFADIKNATDFAKTINRYLDSINLPPLAAMDMETFGEWRGMESIYFLNYLVHQGLNPERFRRSRDMIRPGHIVDNSSWSCGCQLGRWSGDHACAGESEELQKYKRHLYTSLYDRLAEQLDQLNQQDHDWMVRFENVFLNQRANLGSYTPISFSSVTPEYQQPFRNLTAMLVGLTSCGWFYTDSDLERQIPANVLEYLV